jgi:branched-chain amino acid transport system ATP-binding protein
MSDAPLLEVREVHSFYGTSHVLHGVSTVLDTGVTAIVGRNGMGKTTLVKTIMGLVPAQGGSILLRGTSIERLKPYEIASLGVGYVPQGRGLFGTLTVDEHFDLLPQRKGEADWNRERVYELFPRLKERLRSRASSLSGGEQQMLAIGRALVTNPTLLLLDEPSEGLAPVILEQLLETYRVLTRSGMSIFLVEQNLRTATALAGEVAVMVSGRIVATVDAETIMRDKEIRERYLGIRA